MQCFSKKLLFLASLFVLFANEQVNSCRFGVVSARDGDVISNGVSRVISDSSAKLPRSHSFFSLPKFYDENTILNSSDGKLKYLPRRPSTPFSQCILFNEQSHKKCEDGDNEMADCLLSIPKWKLKNTIVLYDCDNVLHRNSDIAMTKQNVSCFLKSLPAEKRMTAIKRAPKVVVEDRVKSLYATLQMLGVPQFILTQCSSDPSMRAWREDILSDLGYNISCGKEESQEIRLENDSPLERKLGQEVTTLPFYEKGIIFAGSAPKGAVFTSFFNSVYRTCINPGASLRDISVIFIDDDLSNIALVKIACHKLNIGTFLGFHYTAVENLFSDLGMGDCDVCALQRNALVSSDLWVDDGGVHSIFRCIFPGLLLTDRTFAQERL